MRPASTLRGSPSLAPVTAVGSGVDVDVAAAVGRSSCAGPLEQASAITITITIPASAILNCGHLRRRCRDYRASLRTALVAVGGRRKPSATSAAVGRSLAPSAAVGAGRTASVSHVAASAESAAVAGQPWPVGQLKLMYVNLIRRRRSRVTDYLGVALFGC